jgi:hypothetical protein
MEKLSLFGDDEKLSFNEKHLSFVKAKRRSKEISSKKKLCNKSLQLKSKVKLINYRQHFSPHFSSLETGEKKEKKNLKQQFR